MEESFDDEDQAGSGYHACYLVGLEPQNTRDPPASEDEGSDSTEVLQAVLYAFDAMTRGDERYYDARFRCMSASLAEKSRSATRASTRVGWASEMLAKVTRRTI